MGGVGKGARLYHVNRELDTLLTGVAPRSPFDDSILALLLCVTTQLGCSVEWSKDPGGGVANVRCR